PSPELLRRINQEQYVEQKAVPDPNEEHKLRRGEQQHGAEQAEASGQREAYGAGRDVAERVDDRVARVAERGGRLAVALDDEVRVLDHFPKALGKDRDPEPPGPGHTGQAPRQHPADDEPMQNVCEGIRVEELLRGVVAPGVTDPEGEVAAGTDPEPPLYVELECRRQEHGDDSEPRSGPSQRVSTRLGLPQRASTSAAAPRLARSRNATAVPACARLLPRFRVFI